MFRSYPAGAKVGDYDPRLRPWYTIAANGPKDVVVVVISLDWNYYLLTYLESPAINEASNLGVVHR